MARITSVGILKRARQLYRENNKQSASLGARLSLGLSSYVGAVRCELELKKGILLDKEHEAAFKEAYIEASVMERNPDCCFYNPNL
jgi:hypothetical protein